MRESVPLVLTLEEIRAIVADLKEDFQRKVNQGALKQALGTGAAALNEQLQALGAMDACDSFLYACRLRAGEFAPATAEKRHEILGAPRRKRGVVTELPAPSPVVRKRVSQ